MLISDWSSDVCSSDLVACRCTLVHCRRCRIAHIRADARIGGACVGRLQQTVLGGAARGLSAEHSFQGLTTGVVGCRPSSRARLGRSEEHTSELQSLMRISYAVFCLKKKKTKKHSQAQH